MSKDFIVFDPNDLDMQPQEKLLGWIDSLVGDGMQSQVEGTPRIVEVISWAGAKYGTTLNEDSSWAAWPPFLLAEGRHCTF